MSKTRIVSRHSVIGSTDIVYGPVVGPLLVWLFSQLVISVKSDAAGKLSVYAACTGFVFAQAAFVA